MRKISISVVVAAMLLFASGYALADTPLTAGYERNTTYQPTTTPFTGNTTLQGLSVMIVLADNDDAEFEVRDSLLASGIADVVDHWDARTSTPTLADLQDYDCVIVWSNYAFYDAVALGDVLADYMEAKGGAVIPCQFALYNLTGYGLAGRFMTDYSPFTLGNQLYQTHYLGWYDPAHPIMENVTDCSDYFCTDPGHRGNVEDVAHYDNDWNLAAANADYPSAVGVNAHFGTNRQWTGDMMRILLNSVVYACGGGAAVTMRCEALTPVFCRGKNLYFTLTVRNNTEDNCAGTLTFTGYGGYDCDPANALVAIPRAKTYAPGETVEYYFFKVPNAAGPGPYSASIGGTLCDVELFCCMNVDIVQCEPWRIGDNTEWELVEAERPEVGLPTVTSLAQNYPNPFNAETNISFDLAEAGNVSLNVYDITGRLVVTLVDGQMDAGSHVVAWDASSVSSGVYFYKLTAGDYSATKSMNLLK